MFTYYSLLNDADKDKWVLFHKAVQEFSLLVFKEDFNATLTREEGELCNDIINLLDAFTVAKIENFKSIGLGIPQFENPVIEPFPKLEISLVGLDTNCKEATQNSQKKDIFIPSRAKAITPSEIKKTLSTWEEIILDLKNSDQRKRIAPFIYRAFLSLPLPHPSTKDFWDEIPEKDLPVICESLTQLAYEGLHATNDGYFYPNVIPLYLAYMFVDKLARRNLQCHLKDYLTPFLHPKFLSSWKHEEVKFKSSNDFAILPMPKVNEAWKAILSYFEIVHAHNKHMLFAFVPIYRKENLSQAVERLKSFHFFQNYSSLELHLKFLQKFLPNTSFDDKMGFDSQLAALCSDTQGKWLPKELCCLHFLAYANFSLGIRRIPVPPEAFKIVTESNNGTIHFTDLPFMKSLNDQAHQLFWYNHATVRTHHSLHLIKDLPEDQKHENAVLCKNVSASHEMNHLVTEWTRIFLEPSLQITSSLQWLQKNIATVKSIAMQDTLERALFQPGLLMEKMQALPEIIPIMRSLIQEGTIFFTSLTEPKLFFIRLGILFEAFQLQNSSIDLTFLKKYETDLIAMLENENDRDLVYFHLLLLYQFALPSDDLSIQHMIEAEFWLAYQNIKEEIPGWIRIEAACTYDLWPEQVRNYFKNPQALNKLGCALLHFFELPQTSQIEVSAQYPTFTCGDYVIDLHQTCIFHGDALLIPLPDDISTYFPRQQKQVWLTNNTYFSSDIRINLSFEGPYRRLNISKRFSTEWGTFWYNQAKVKFSDDHPLFLINNAKAWVVEDSCPERHTLLITGVGEVPDCVLLTYNDQDELWKLNEHGHRVGLKYVLHDRAFFERLGLAYTVVSWFDVQKKRITLLQISRLSLEFEEVFVGGRWRMECKEHPGYLIANQQQLAVLNDYEGALILEKQQHKMILLATSAFQKNSSFFSASTTTHLADHYSDHPSIYILEPGAAYVKSSDPQANMQLALLFALQRDYPKALHYLNYAKKFNDYLFGYTHKFEQLTDYSPEGLAFFMRLGIFFNEQHFQFTQTGELSFRFYLWLADRYHDYLNVLSSHRASRIPKNLRLLAHEELYILNYLHPILNHIEKQEAKKGDDISFSPPKRWLPIFQIRLDLLNKGKYKSTIDPLNYRLLSKPIEDLWKIDFSQCVSPFSNQIITPASCSYFLRLTPENVASYFTALFERSKMGNSQLDILYMVRSKSSSLTVLAALLNYVSHFPKEFSSIQFGHDAVENEKSFQLVIEKISTIRAKIQLRFSKIKEDKTFLPFNYSNTSDLFIEKNYPHQPVKNYFSFSKNNKEYLKDVRYEVFNIFLDKYIEVHTVPQMDKSIAHFPLMHKEGDQKFVKNLKKGYAKLCDPQYGKSHFSLKNSMTIEECLSEARKLFVKYEEKIQSAKQKAESAANWISSENYSFNLRQKGRDLPTITMEKILTQTYLTDNHQLLKEANPTLSDIDIQHCVTQTIIYHLYCIIKHQLQLGIEALEKGNVQEFGRAIAIYGSNLDPTEEPEIFIYQARTGKTLRPEQAHLFNWYTKKTLHIGERQASKSLFAFPPGGGKTTVFHTIAIQRFQRLGYFPVSISSAPLYSVDRQGQKISLLDTFELDLAAWDLTLDSKKTAADFRQFYRELLRYQNSKVLKITPQVFYTLDLRYKLALENADEDEVFSLSHILFDVFKKKAAALADECRITFSPMTEAKIGIGKPVVLPIQDRKIFLSIYRALYAFDSMLKLGKNLHATVDETILKQVKELACNYLLEKLSFFTTTHEQRQDILDYWIKDTEEPAWFSTHAQYREIDAVKIYFDVFYADAMKLIGNMKHRPSARPDEEIHVPARRKQPTSGYFKEHYLALIATIHGLLQQGLDEKQSQKLIDKMKKLHSEEVGNSSKISQTEEIFQACMGTQERLVNYEFSSQIHEKLHKDPEAIFFFLEHIALPQITYNEEYINSGPMHFANAFRKIDFCSANPSQKQMYGILEMLSQMTCFLPAWLIEQLSNAKNSQLMIFPALNCPLDFFKWLHQYHPSYFDHLGIITDAGGMLRDFSSDEISAAFFTFLKESTLDFDGVIFFEETNHEEEGEDYFYISKMVTNAKLLVTIL